MSNNPKTASNGAAKKKRRSPAGRFITTVVKILIVFFVVLSFALVGIMGGAVFGWIKTASPITAEQLMMKGLTSNIYDGKGNLVEPVKGLINREEVSYDQIPKYLEHAFVAVEDARFYEHKGVDIIRFVGAVINTLKGKTQGGSTITQQVVRNLTGNFQISPQRKIQEQWAAIQLEKKLEKWKIIELYTNVIFMGHNYYGVESASKAYFGKDVSELSLAECACIAGITNAPARYDPFTTNGRKESKERQELILALMKKQGYISEQEYDQAMKEELKFMDSPKTTAKSTSNQSYFAEQVIADVKKDLMAKYNWSEQMAIKAIYNNGLKIYSTWDVDIQKAMDQVFQDDKYFPVVNKNVEHSQAAMVILDPQNGQVKALYGGYGEKKIDMGLNRATQMKRQAGSSFKPIAIYGPAINERRITASTVIDDVPVYMDTQHPNELYPSNYDSGAYKGLLTVRSALRQSVNVVSAKILKEYIDPDISMRYLKNVGINLNKDKDRNISALALGGLTDGVNPYLMAAAYQPFANKGLYTEPTTYTKVLDKDGKALLETKGKNTIVYDETAAYIMTDMLKGVVTAGTAQGFGEIKNKNGEVIPTAGKTGTTSNFVDKWFVGFSPYYIGATWYGYDNSGGKQIRLSQAEYNQALTIWHAVMEKAHENLSVLDFPEPSGLVKKNVCVSSGKVPTEICFKDPRNPAQWVESVYTDELYIKGTEPKDSDKCDVHVLAKVDTESKDLFGRPLLAGPYCPLSQVVERVFIQRKQPYTPTRPEDPYPLDWIYELPAGEYCNIHGSPVPEVKSTPGVPANNSLQSGAKKPETISTTPGVFPTVTPPVGGPAFFPGPTPSATITPKSSP